MSGLFCGAVSTMAMLMLALATIGPCHSGAVSLLGAFFLGMILAPIAAGLACGRGFGFQVAFACVLVVECLVFLGAAIGSVRSGEAALFLSVPGILRMGTGAYLVSQIMPWLPLVVPRVVSGSRLAVKDVIVAVAGVALMIAPLAVLSRGIPR